MAAWDGLLTPDEQTVFEAFRRPKSLGKRPAVLIVDVNYAFVGLEPANIVDSVKDYSTSCGERGWQAIDSIQRLIESGRGRGVPIVYSTGLNATRAGAHWANRGRDRNSQRVLPDAELEHRRIGNRIVEQIAPAQGDLVVEKRAPSAFFGTALVSYLNELDIDTLIVAGTTTSGCVRASVVDAAAYNFYVGVVEECCFDRFDISHRVSLMDMHAKYGQVLSLSDAEAYLGSAEAALADAPELALR
jgi:nicotinamidase-related amidase